MDACPTVDNYLQCSMVTFTLSQIAAKYGVSRQRIHYWLRTKQLLDQCQVIVGPGGEKKALLFVPEQLLAAAPFVTGKNR